MVGLLVVLLFCFCFSCFLADGSRLSKLCVFLHMSARHKSDLSTRKSLVVHMGLMCDR